MLLYFTTTRFSKYGLFNLLFSFVMGLYATQKNSISAFQPYSFQRRRRYRTQLFPVLGFYNAETNISNCKFVGIANMLKTWAPQHFSLLLLFEIRIDGRICCWLLWLSNISWHCWNFECILMEKLFDDAIKKVRKKQMLSETKTNVYRLVFS